MHVAGFLITLGVLFLAGLAADQLGRATHLPRVTTLLFLGLIAGNAGMGLIPLDVAIWFDEVSIVALTMVAFLLGGSLTRENLVRHGRAILTISISIVIATFLIVSAGLTAVLPSCLAFRRRLNAMNEHSIQHAASEGLSLPS